MRVFSIGSYSSLDGIKGNPLIIYEYHTCSTYIDLANPNAGYQFSQNEVRLTYVV